MSLFIKKINNNEKVIAVFLNVAIVFDTIIHKSYNELIRILPSYGIVNESAMVQKPSGKQKTK